MLVSLASLAIRNAPRGCGPGSARCFGPAPSRYQYAKPPIAKMRTAGPGLGSRPTFPTKTREQPKPIFGSHWSPNIFYRVARTTLPCSKVGLSVSHWNCLILGSWGSTNHSRKAGRRRRFGLAGDYCAQSSARRSLFARSQEPDSQRTCGERYTCHPLACCPRCIHCLIDRLPLAGPA